jgi:hypothetical protein
MKTVASAGSATANERPLRSSFAAASGPLIRYRGQAPTCVLPLRNSSLFASTSPATARPRPSPAWSLNSKCWPPNTRERPASAAAAEKLG